MELPKCTPKTRAGLAFEAYNRHKLTCPDCRHLCRCGLTGVPTAVRCERGEALLDIASEEIAKAMPR